MTVCLQMPINSVTPHRPSCADWPIKPPPLRQVCDVAWRETMNSTSAGVALDLMLSVFPTLINHTHLLTSSHLLKIKIFPVMSQTSWCLNVIDSSFTYLIKTILSYASFLTCQFIICSLVNLLKIPVFHIVFCFKKKIVFMFPLSITLRLDFISSGWLTLICKAWHLCSQRSVIYYSTWLVIITLIVLMHIIYASLMGV